MESCVSSQIKNNEQELEVLKNQVEIYYEKVNFLEEKLSYISLERDQDEKTFNDIINDTKTKLLDTICQIKRVDTSNEFETHQLISLTTWTYGCIQKSPLKFWISPKYFLRFGDLYFCAGDFL